MKLIKYIFLIVGLIVTTSCEKDFLDINENPNTSTEVQPDLLFTHAITRLSATKTIETGPPANFFAQSWVTGRSTSVFIDPERYVISIFTTGNSWNQFYTNGIKNLKLAIDLAESATPVNNNGAAQCKIVVALYGYYLTSMWGDVPFSQAVNFDYSMPTFDTQQQVFEGIIALLDEAIAQIDVDSPVKISTTDLYYNGDMNRWRKFAKSLQFRSLMMLADNDPSAATRINELIVEGDMISTNGESAAYPFFDSPGNENPYWKLSDTYSGNENVWFYGSRVLVDIMNGLNDPRLSVYFREGEAADPGEFIGVDPGVGATVVSSPVNEEWLAPDAPDQILTYSEQLLYEAEAHARGLATGGLAEADVKFRAGVRASLVYYGVSNTTIDDYLTSFPDLATLSNEEATEIIQLLQYIGLFGRDVDVWNHWRRTEVVELTLPSGATLSTIIRRFPYPPDELASNTNAPSQPALDEKMWFDN